MIRNTVGRLERGSRARRATPPAAPPPPDSDAELHQLARDAARVFAEDLARFKKAKGERLDPVLEPHPSRLANAELCPPEDFTLQDFEQLSRADPARATRRWEEVKAAARQDLDSGWLAGRILEGAQGHAWERACFLAVRDRLRQMWPPRQAAEALLIHEIAQYEMIRQQWVRTLAQFSREQEAIADLKYRRDDLKDPEKRTVGAVEATREAAAMVERVQRLQQNAIRTLLSLRRTQATVTVRNTGPVNVALGPQLNVGPPPPENPAPRIVTPVIEDPGPPGPPADDAV